MTGVIQLGDKDDKGDIKLGAWDARQEEIRNNLKNK